MPNRVKARLARLKLPGPALIFGCLVATVIPAVFWSVLVSAGAASLGSSLSIAQSLAVFLVLTAFLKIVFTMVVSVGDPD